MFPLIPTGAFQKAFNSSKPNANEAIAVASASASNPGFCYDNDPSTYGELVCAGGSSSTPTINFTGTSGSFPAAFPTFFARPLAGFLLYHSPTSGLVAATQPSVAINVSATAQITGVTKGTSMYPDLILYTCLPDPSNGTANILYSELVASGQAANAALSGGSAYTVSLSTTISRLVPTGLDVNGLGIIVCWGISEGGAAGVTGSVTGVFDAKIYDVNIAWP